MVVWNKRTITMIWVGHQRTFSAVQSISLNCRLRVQDGMPRANMGAGMARMAAKMRMEGSRMVPDSW